MDNADDTGHWNHQRTLGAGAFGVVELWRNDNSGNYIAIKKCRGGASQLTDKQKKRWVLEVKTMNSLSHPNIVSTRRVPTELGDIGTDVPVLCMEYCDRGDLRTLLNQCENCCGIEESQALKIMHDISSAVEYLHSRTLVHRDLKPENIVIRGTREKSIYKLTDLGYVRELGEDSIDASVVGTCNYLAPELLWKSSYTCSVDYWSLGILFYEVITGNRPFLPNMPITPSWLKHVEKKGYKDICARGCSGSVTFGTEIESPSTISDCMRPHLTPWFRVALQWDPRKRGKDPESPEHHDNLVVFSLLKSILETKIVHVFVVPLYRIDSYAVSSNIGILEMQRLIHEKTGIEIAHQTLTDRLGYPVNQTDAALFSCIEEPHLVVFQRDELRVESPPRVNMSPPVRQIFEFPQNTLDCETIRRCYAAALFFIRQQLDLFRSYVIAMSIKIDLSNSSLESLRGTVKTLRTNADSLLSRLFVDAQSPEHQLMSVELKEVFETTFAKTQKLLEGSQIVVAKLEELSSDFENLKVFSESNWLENWTRLHELAGKTYESSVKRNSGQRDTPIAMARLVYRALKLHEEQLQSPEIEAVVSEITHFDSNILQLQVSLDSFEALVNHYQRNLDDILRSRATALPPNTPYDFIDPINEIDKIIVDNIILSKLNDSALDAFQDHLMDLGDLEF